MGSAQWDSGRVKVKHFMGITTTAGGTVTRNVEGFANHLSNDNEVMSLFVEPSSSSWMHNLVTVTGYLSSPATSPGTVYEATIGGNIACVASYTEAGEARILTLTLNLTPIGGRGGSDPVPKALY